MGFSLVPQGRAGLFLDKHQVLSKNNAVKSAWFCQSLPHPNHGPQIYVTNVIYLVAPLSLSVLVVSQHFNLVPDPASASLVSIAKKGLRGLPQKL